MVEPTLLSTMDMARFVADGYLRFDAVVPSLRVDALGAKAFRVSRSFFRKGIEAGNVTVNGSAVGKSGVVAEADEVYADGLGRYRRKGKR